ncbi:AAA domain-containing protein [Paenibacillus sp. RC67]|uniref:AAA domain-containing protein n=1 Tax=Paenibacillus sp. RC67 TaxID=3039392 RepID=UPI0024ADFA92|nr:AAA domain-containing protein [Paenibacillus sp. RC67]
MLSKAMQIFEYLLAVKNLDEKPIRSLDQYERVWWQHQLPVGEGCNLYGTGKNQEAWLEVCKQQVEPPPSLPLELSGWIKDINNPETEPVVVKSVVVDLADGREEYFGDDLVRISIYESWLDTWRQWAQVMLPRQRINDLYTHLFAVHQQFQREGDSVELVWGHGLFTWAPGGEKIKRPLITTKLELQFEPKQRTFYLLPTSAGTILESDMLANIDVPNIQRIQEMGRQLTEIELDFSREESLLPLLQEVVQTISPQGKYVQEANPTPIDATPSISFSPVIMLRKSGGRLWQNELSNVLESLRNGYPIPDTIQMLISDEEGLGESEPPEGHSTSTAVGAGSSELLFPLPSNEDQRQIAYKLERSAGVVVQGPPGTGKSHTIANLISHLLAQGKRILVTSQGEKALKVVKAKIPEEIRSLCVSLLGGDSKAMKELEDSISTIAENLDRWQPAILEKRIKELRDQLHETRKNIARLHHEMREAAARENQTLSISGSEMTPLDIGKWLAEYVDYSWFPDTIPFGSSFPLSDEGLQAFVERYNRLTLLDMEELESARPSSSTLPAPEVFLEHARSIEARRTKVQQTAHTVNGWNIEHAPAELGSLKRQLLDALEKLHANAEPWFMTILNEVVTHSNRVQEWENFVVDMIARLNRIRELESTLRETELVFPDTMHPTIAKELLIELRSKLYGGGQVGWLLKMVTGRKFKPLFEQVRLNGLPIRNADDAERVLHYIELKDLKQKTSLGWNRIMEEFDGVLIDAEMKRFSSTLETLLAKLKLICQWHGQMIVPLGDSVSLLGAPLPRRWIEAGWFQSLLDGIEAIEARRLCEEAERFTMVLESKLHAGKPAENPNILWDQLLEVCVSLDGARYRSLYAEILRLESLVEPYSLVRVCFDKLQQTAPNWLQALQAEKNAGHNITIPSDLQEAWLYSQISSWWAKHQKAASVEEMQQELMKERRLEAKLIRDYVTHSTWLTQIKQVTRAQKASLHAWMSAMKRIGKGTGKYANMYRKEATSEMNSCRSAIPVWIMPIQKVIENMQLTDQSFDVAIIDESSQSNIFALSVLLRAKKVIVVGDDNQISPESFDNISDVSDLMNRYLIGIPHHRRYELKTSLFDLASQMFGSKIVLKEHFRCVPEIIQFSNDLMYGGSMDPLRLPSVSERMEPAILAIHVSEGYRKDGAKALNQPEAEALVQCIKECIANPRYARKSMGVISLQANDQAKLIEDLLRDQIGAEEMANRNITCGDAYNFQGDERDIIFLSMVAAPNRRTTALTKRSDQQRFNVAASRARDQMILFHSVKLNDLNSDCMRYRLLEYCQNPGRTIKEFEEVQHEFDSQFEQDVFKLISSRGYRVIPQYKVGTYGRIIDLVIEGLRSRLAVECDGDKWHGIDAWEADMDRQRILERVGWRFWRVRGSTFYRDRAKAMEPLWQLLDEMEIERREVECKGK